jgi:DNA-binding response OmpR family regulator
MGRILIVEDDQAICALIADALETAGLDPVCARTDQEAYAALATRPAFRALVVDVNLGQGATGFDVARFARQRVPHIPVVYVSGDSPKGTFVTHGVPDSDFVAKPFTPAELLATLQARLAKGR